MSAETGTAAACSKVRFAGLGASLASSAQAYSAKEPSQVPNTSSPGLNRVTSLPTASTRPGDVRARTRCLRRAEPEPVERTRYGRPVMRCQTPGSTPAARTRTSTSSSPTAGLAMSSSSSTSVEPYCVLDDRACIVGLPDCCLHRRPFPRLRAGHTPCLRCKVHGTLQRKAVKLRLARTVGSTPKDAT